MWRLLYPFFFVLQLAVTCKIHADTITLNIINQPQSKHEYYVALIEQSLRLTGHTAVIHTVPYTPYMRSLHMLKNGDLSIFWLLKRPKWEKEFTSVNVGLTNGLIAQRVLLIVPGSQPKYEPVDSLEEFRRLGAIGAFGKGWFDIEIWKANRLPYVEVADWRKIFRMLESGNRGIDYFSRGINEVLGEVQEHPGLNIERRLLFVYNNDFIFYLSPKVSHYKDILKKSLVQAKKTGLMDTLIEQYWGPELRALNYGDRKIIRLDLPAGTVSDIL